MSCDLVKFVCVRDGTKLRVRIISPGYKNQVNVQFPRDIRRPGAMFTAPFHAVNLRQTSSGTYFYHVARKYVSVVTPTDETPPLNLESLRIFEVDSSPDCCICMSEEKSIVFMPCGHYCTCAECAQSINDKCPICRAKIGNYVRHEVVMSGVS